MKRDLSQIMSELSRNRRSLSSSAGFTLIEIVISIGILALIFSVAFSALTQISRTKKLLDDERDVTQIANAVLSRMTRELQLVTDEAKLMGPRNDPSKVYTGKVSLLGASNNLANGRRGDEITFMANDAGQYVPDGLTHAGLVQITYRVAEDPDAPAGKGATFYLVRDEVPNIRPAAKAYEKIMTFPITRNFVSLKFSYFDGKEWTSEWDENKKALPTLVKFTVKVRSPAGRIYNYTTMVPVKR